MFARTSWLRRGHRPLLMWRRELLSAHPDAYGKRRRALRRTPDPLAPSRAVGVGHPVTYVMTGGLFVNGVFAFGPRRRQCVEQRRKWAGHRDERPANREERAPRREFRSVHREERVLHPELGGGHPAVRWACCCPRVGEWYTLRNAPLASRRASFRASRASVRAGRALLPNPSDAVRRPRAPRDRRGPALRGPSGFLAPPLARRPVRRDARRNRSGAVEADDRRATKAECAPASASGIAPRSESDGTRAETSAARSSRRIAPSSGRPAHASRCTARSPRRAARPSGIATRGERRSPRSPRLATRSRPSRKDPARCAACSERLHALSVTWERCVRRVAEAAQIDGEDAVSRREQRDELLKGPRGRGKAVDQKDRRAALPGGYVVKVGAVNLRVVVVDACEVGVVGPVAATFIGVLLESTTWPTVSKKRGDA
jgi:hypothetical protein